MAKTATPRNANDDDAAPSAPRNRGEKGRNAAEKAVKRARATASDAVDRARAVANEAVDTAANAVDSAPLSALAGAIAIGAVAAALIPATAREVQLLGPLGDRTRRAFGDAFAAAKGAGIEQLTTKGITQTALSSGLGTVIGHFMSAAMEASKAAGDSVRRKDQPVKTPRSAKRTPQTNGDR